MTEEAMEIGAGGNEFFRWDMQRLSALLYDDDEIITSTRAAPFQPDFDALTEMFDLVGLYTNVAKTLSMDYQTCHTLRGHST